jgi:hypothetical protein
MMLRRLRSAFLTLILVFIGVQLLVEAVSGYMPLIIAGLVIVAVVGMISNRRL